MGKAGDILIQIRVAAHPWFRRQGNNLEVTVPVTLGEAAAGTTVDVPSPNGTIALKIPPGCSSGKRLRIKGHGVPSSNGSPGDLLAEIQIELPEHISDDDLAAIEKLDLGPRNPRSKLIW